jgi:hypothetical protein
MYAVYDAFVSGGGTSRSGQIILAPALALPVAPV